MVSIPWGTSSRAANDAGVRTSALITDMNQPLADAAGNALEIVNCLDFLNGKKAGTRLEDIVLAVAAEMLVQSGQTENLSEAKDQASLALSSGRALEVFGRMVAALGGPLDFVERPQNYLASAPVSIPALAQRSGFVSLYDTRAIGMAVVELGGGRRRASDMIDHRMGISEILPLGSRVEKGDPLAVVHALNHDDAARIVQYYQHACGLSEDAPSIEPIIRSRIG